MADGRDGFVGAGEVPDDVEHPRIQAQVFGRAATGHNQGVVGGGVDGREVGIEGETVAGLLGVGLRTLEIVHGSGDGIAGLLVGADRMHRVADHLECLEGHHHFVVFDIVAHQHQNLFRHRRVSCMVAVCPLWFGASGPGW